MKKDEILTKFKHLFFADYTKKQRNTSFFIAAGFSVISIIIILFSFIFLESTNPLNFIDDLLVDKFYLRRYKSGQALYKSEDLAKAEALTLINIDDQSLIEMGLKWPIPRSIYVELLQKLQKADAKVIGFDIIFENESNPEEDAKMADILRTMDNVILANYLYLSKESIDLEKLGTDKEDDGSSKLKVANPFPPFTEAVQSGGRDRIGLVSLKIDQVVRTAMLAEKVQGKEYFALSTLMVADYLGIPRSEMKYKQSEQKLTYFQFGEKRIPTRKDRLFIINYLFAPGEFSYRLDTKSNVHEFINEFSLKNVMVDMDEEIFNRSFKDKIVLIGPTAKEIGDIKITPFGWIPGVYNHANIIISLLTDKYLKNTETGQNILYFNLFIIFISGVIIGLIIPRFSPVAGTLFTILFCYSYYQFAYFSFVHQGTVNLISIPVLCAFSGFLVINIYHHVAETRTKESFSRMFKEFAPLPSDQIEKYIEEYAGDATTGSESAHMTILFADIRGYTQMSETMSSKDVVDVLNRYHQAMGDIFARTGGVIFTYIGDAQLVVYGMEGISRKNHAAAAIKAGLLMDEKMEEIKEELAKEGKYVFEVGVGLCTGKLSLSIVGSKHLKQYTVIGDTVNVASRIQGMSRELNSPCLIHERTYLMARNCIDAERLRPVKLKGKTELVNVYRAKEVFDIIPYPGDEIVDLDREVKELHDQLEEERRKRREEREKALKGREKPQDESLPAGIRKGTRKRFKAGTPGGGENTQEIPDDLEPVVEQSKGEVPTADEDSDIQV